MELFAEQTLTPGTNIYTFSSIPQTHRNLRIYVHGSMHPTASYSTCSLRFNGDTSNGQYSGMSGWSCNGTNLTGQTYNNSIMFFPVMAGSTQTYNNMHSVVEIILPNYSESTSDGYKTAHGQAYIYNGGSDSYSHLILSSMRSRVTSAITSLTFSAPSPDLYNDPRILIYGE